MSGTAYFFKKMVLEGPQSIKQEIRPDARARNDRLHILIESHRHFSQCDRNIFCENHPADHHEDGAGRRETTAVLQCRFGNVVLHIEESRLLHILRRGPWNGAGPKLGSLLGRGPATNKRTNLPKAYNLPTLWNRANLRFS